MLVDSWCFVVNELLEFHGLPLALEVSFALFVRSPASNPLLDILLEDSASLEAVAHRFAIRRNPFGLLALDSLPPFSLPFAFVVDKQTIGVCAVLLAGGNSAASGVVPVITLAVLRLAFFFRLAEVLDFVGFHLDEALERCPAIARSPLARVGLAPVFVLVDGKHVARAVIILVAAVLAVAVAEELETGVKSRFLAPAASAHSIPVRAFGQLRYLITLHVTPKVAAIPRSPLARIGLAPAASALGIHVASAA